MHVGAFPQDQELLEHRRKPFVEWKFFWEEARWLDECGGGN